MTTFTICDGCAQPIEKVRRISASIPTDDAVGSDYHHFHNLDCLRKFLGLDWPKPGVWLVQEFPGGFRRAWIQIGDVPDPMPLAAIERRRSTMVIAVYDLLAKQPEADASMIVDAILARLREKEPSDLLRDVDETDSVNER